MDTSNEIKFDHPPTPEELADAYIKAQESDPTSPYYKRDLVRPEISWARAIALTLSTLVISVSVGIVVLTLTKSVGWAVATTMVVLLALILCMAKSIVTWCVKCYQRYAPESVRMRCRFEPSCSQYTLLAIEKYGLIKGGIKSVRRWRRCKPPNGGIDLP